MIREINGEPGKDGVNGYSPVKGLDYFTDDEKEEMIENAAKNSADIVENDINNKIENDLQEYYKKTETYNRTEIDNKISVIPKFDIKVVDSLPTENIEDATLYLVKSGEESNNLYTEYIYADGKWEQLGTQKLDLSIFYNKDEINSLIKKRDEKIENLEQENQTQQEKIDANGEKVSELDDRVTILEENTHLESLTWEDIERIVQADKVDNYFNVGDELTEKWIHKTADSDTEYEDTPMYYTHNGNAIIQKDGEDIAYKAMFLEWKYTIPNAFAFCIPQALQYFENGLPAGKYCFFVSDFHTDWANARDVYRQKYLCFESTKDIPSGGTLRGSGIGNNASGWKVALYSDDNQSSTALEVITLEISDTKPSEYTYLGATWGEDVGYGILNHIECVAYGDNTWRDSDLRQWLNSDSDSWWEKKTRYNIKPTNASTLKGFLSGYKDEFKNRIKTIKNATYTNSVKEKEGIVYTYDKIFLHSPNQRNCTGQDGNRNDEGETWNYYKKLAEGQSNLDSSGRFKVWNTYPILIRYSLSAKASAQYVFSRSARRALAYHVWSILTSGFVSYNAALYPDRCLPACII